MKRLQYLLMGPELKRDKMTDSLLLMRRDSKIEKNEFIKSRSFFYPKCPE